MTSFFEKEWEEVKEFFDETEAAAITILKASIQAVVSDIKTYGLPAVLATATAMGTAAAQATAAGKSPSEAGQAALAVVETAAVSGAVHEGEVAVTAGKAALSASSAYAVATAQVTAVGTSQ